MKKLRGQDWALEAVQEEQRDKYQGGDGAGRDRGLLGPVAVPGQ